MLFTILFGCVIVINDYYRAVPVQNETFHENEDVNNEPISTNENPSNREVSICVTGDNLIHESVYLWAEQLAKNSNNDSFDFRPMYADIEPIIRGADFSIVNQSSLVSAVDNRDFASGYPLFCSPSQLGRDLISLGFDGVNLINNHMLDYGETGLYRSLNFWEEQGAVILDGTLQDVDVNSYEDCIIVLNGIRIAVLIYTEHTNGILPSNKTRIPYYCYKQGSILEQMLTKDVASCAEISDFVIVLMNWGNAAGFDPSQKQRDAAQILCDAGADLIIGTGAKVIQPVVELHSKKQDRETLCFYSLGNIMGTMDYMENLFGGLLSFKVKNEQGKTFLSDVKFHPTVIFYDEHKEKIEVKRLENYTGKLNVKHGSNIKLGMTDPRWFDETLQKSIDSDYL